MKKIEKIESLRKEIDKIYKRIHRLQESCKHKHVTKKHGSNTGNYDPTQDCYWTDFTCLDCDKRWTEDGSK